MLTCTRDACSSAFLAGVTLFAFSGVPVLFGKLARPGSAVAEASRKHSILGREVVAWERTRHGCSACGPISSPSASPPQDGSCGCARRSAPRVSCRPSAQTWSSPNKINKALEAAFRFAQAAPMSAPGARAFFSLPQHLWLVQVRPTPR